jgi:hypothetical protein
MFIDDIWKTDDCMFPAKVFLKIVMKSYEDQDVGGWIILGWILCRDRMWVVWTGLVWLRIETDGELL